MNWRRVNFWSVVIYCLACGSFSLWLFFPDGPFPVRETAPDRSPDVIAFASAQDATTEPVLYMGGILSPSDYYYFEAHCDGLTYVGTGKTRRELGYPGYIGCAYVDSCKNLGLD